MNQMKVIEIRNANGGRERRYYVVKANPIENVIRWVIILTCLSALAYGVITHGSAFMRLLGI